MILTHNSLFTSYLAAVGGVTVGEQEVAAGEQRAQAGAADHQDPARARRPGRQKSKYFSLTRYFFRDGFSN